MLKPALVGCVVDVLFAVGLDQSAAHGDIVVFRQSTAFDVFIANANQLTKVSKLTPLLTIFTDR